MCKKFTDIKILFISFLKFDFRTEFRNFILFKFDILSYFIY